MPVVLAPDRWNEWLDRENDDVAALSRLFVPARAELFTVHPVSTEVNNVRNDGAHLIEESDPDDLPG
jgi:putative SOS response-associated peptidase YedK